MDLHDRLDDNFSPKAQVRCGFKASIRSVIERLATKNITILSPDLSLRAYVNTKDIVNGYHDIHISVLHVRFYFV